MRSMILGFDLQGAREERTCLGEILHLQIFHAKIAKNEHAVGIEVERALERHDALRVLAVHEERPAEATEDLWVI